MQDNIEDSFSAIEKSTEDQINDPALMEPEVRQACALKHIADLKDKGTPVEKRLRLTLEHFYGDQFRYNELTMDIEFKGKPIASVEFEEAHHFIDDVVMGHMAKQNHAKSAIRYVANKNAYHPVAIFLNHMAEHEPNDVSAAEVCKHVLGVDDPLSIRYVECWLAGAVSKALDPQGSKFIEVLTLLSPLQGIGKSHFFFVLASPTWFSDSFSESTGKDLILGLHRAWINELGEVDQYAARARDFKSLKSLISQVADMIRVPFGVKPEHKPRRFVMGATANESDLFAVDDQQRRFWVIEPQPTDDSGRLDMQWLIENRCAIWATATRRFKELGEEAFKLTAEERNETIERNNFYKKENNVDDDTIAQTLERYSIRRISTKEVRDHILNDPRARLQSIASILKSLGYKKIRKAKKLGETFESLYDHADRLVDFDPQTWKIREFTE